MIVNRPREVIVNRPREVIVNRPREVIVNRPREVIVNRPWEVKVRSYSINICYYSGGGYSVVAIIIASFL